MKHFQKITRYVNRKHLSPPYIFLKNNMSSKVQSLKFDNKVLRELPIDSEKNNFTRTVNGACFSLIDTTPVENPSVVAFSSSALKLLGLTEEDVTDEKFAEYFGGNELIPGSKTAAHSYCGHQFGYFSGQLGDGAAIYLGEIINNQNERWELQLKGAGKTPYSRNADGRKVLRSSIREFLCSEAMHYLGVPTTRAGSCVTSDSRVVRDIFYDGNPIMERCTIVSRIAPTFIRFGSFEIFKPQDRYTGRKGSSVGRTDILHKMLNYVIESFYNEIYLEHSEDKERCYLEFYKEVVRKTAKLVAYWQCVGFCHGVLNTDNMSIVGVTIDYGPYGFMDYFDADFICNDSDNNGRYSYKAQPEICKWNLLKLAEAIKEALPLEKSKKCLDEIYDLEFQLNYYGMMRKKLGIKKVGEGTEDEELIQNLLSVMQETSADFTNTFRLLSSVPTDFSSLESSTISNIVQTFVDQCQNIEGVKKKYKSNVNLEQIMTLLKIAETNPMLLQQLGIDGEQLHRMVTQAEKAKEFSNLTQDKKSVRDKKLWTDWLKLYSERLQRELKNVNQDKETIEEFQKERIRSMDSANPRFILRNYMAQEAIKSAEEGDYSKVQDLLKLLEDPFTEDVPSFLLNIESEEASSSSETGNNKLLCKYACAAPAWASDLRVS